MVESKVKHSPFPEKSIYCNQCKGKLVTPGDQKAARDTFGIVPNKCVPAANGRCLCPYQ